VGIVIDHSLGFCGNVDQCVGSQSGANIVLGLSVQVWPLNMITFTVWWCMTKFCDLHQARGILILLMIVENI